MARTKLQDKSLREAAIHRRKAGRFQQMAQNWVESLFTESLVMLLVIFDISLTVVEAESAKAGKTEVRNTLSRSHIRAQAQPRRCAHPPTQPNLRLRAEGKGIMMINTKSSFVGFS
jgi:hypothetical protein